MNPNIPVTTRAESRNGSRLLVVPSFGAHRVVHELPMPVAACPVSRNPLSGTVRVAYVPTGWTIEVVSLHDALIWACSGAKEAPRSVEDLASWLENEAHLAVGRCSVRLDLMVSPGPQRLIVWR